MTVRLDDRDTATTLLSETFERDDPDGFAVQDDVVRAIAGLLGPEIQKIERARAVRRLSLNPTVYDLFAQGMWWRYRPGREDLDRAMTLFCQALAIDLAYAPATAALALCLNYAAMNDWTNDIEATRMESLALARRAVADDGRDPHAHFALGVACMMIPNYPEAVMVLREAVRLNPSHAYARANLGHVSNYLDRPNEAIGEIETAMRLNPHDPRRYMWLPYLAASHYLMGRYREALAVSEQALVANPGFPLATRYLLASLGQLGRIDEARQLLPLVRRHDPTLTDMEARTRRFFITSAADRLIDGFRRAGLT